jgi:glycine cleavage system regulatory protein
MRTSLVLTVIGDDEPGIVEKLADRILAADANWEESRMARLAGKFAGLLRVSVEADRADALEAGLRTLNAGSLAIVVQRSTEPTAEPVRVVGLQLIGNDHPGIIRDISRVLASRGVNIDALETDLTSAPMSGETLFSARAHLRIPSSVSLDDLRLRLEALAGELMVDLTVDEPPLLAGVTSTGGTP